MASRFAEALINLASSWLFSQPLSDACRPCVLLQLTIAAVSTRFLLKLQVFTRLGLGAGFVTSGYNFLQSWGALLAAHFRYLGPRFGPVPELMLLEITTQQHSFLPLGNSFSQFFPPSAPGRNAAFTYPRNLAVTAVSFNKLLLFMKGTIKK